MGHTESLIIGGIYQIIGQIGSGGGGIVYLAEHLRLHKKVVLKADRRNLATKSEVLRREVDALKDLSHTYIPQVYDFIVEGDTVYTVMDYIDGDSFDKPLKRGERFSQAKVIEWACQLLDALDYLHSRPPHGILHADIKPANVMLTPQGDVRLIDFNIALALGEKGAVAVGRSFGYASPEHYGLDYAAGNVTQGVNTDVATDLASKSISDIETVLETRPEVSDSGGSTSNKKDIMLDVRSDIYSLGATLYHIMSGKRPAQNAKEVGQISPDEYSPAVIAIIKKAMNPNPDLRYQSAKEMLYDFEHLRDRDLRVIRWRCVRTMISTFLALAFVAGGVTAFVGARRGEELQRIQTEIQRAEAQTQELYVLAAYSSESLRNGNRSEAIDYALRALSEERGAYIAEAQNALTDALNVYDLSDGFKHSKTVELPSAPLYLRISPDGTTATAVYANELAIFDTEKGEILKTLSTEKSALAEAEYINGDILIYAGDGGIRAYDIRKDVEMWRGAPCTALVVSADGTKVAAVYKDESHATIYSTPDGRMLHEVDFEGKHQRVAINDSFANPNDNLFILNRDSSKLAASFADGSLWVYDLSGNGENLEILDSESGFTQFEGGFHNIYLAFSATNATESIFAVVDTVALEQTGGFDSTFPFHVQANESGIVVQTENILVKVHPVTGEQIPLATVFDEIAAFSFTDFHALVTTKTEYIFFDQYANLMVRYEKEHSSDFVQIADNIAIIGSLDTPTIRIMKLETHQECEIFAYDPIYIHEEARVSADGKTVMLFSYDEFLLFDMNGQIIKNVFIPNAEQVYDQQYRRDEDGSYLQVIYNDGTICAYSAQDGSVLYETAGELPDLSLYEEFFTDTLRIESPLHGVPVSYNQETGELVRELEKNAYLTYVTQVDKYIVTEYISAEGERYGLLLNEACETLAKLPYLCDIVEDMLIFDYPTGSLRESRIYSIEELIALAKKEDK